MLLFSQKYFYSVEIFYFEMNTNTHYYSESEYCPVLRYFAEPSTEPS